MKIIISALLLVPVISSAGIHSLTLKPDFNVSAPRWMYGEKAKAKKSSITSILIALKKSEASGKYLTCYSLAKRGKVKAKSLKPWLIKYQLKCLSQLVPKNASHMVKLDSVHKEMKANYSWLVLGAHKESLMEAYINSLMVAFTAYIKTNRKKAWTYFEELNTYSENLDEEEKAKMYRLAGELAFIEQKFLVAQNYLIRSISEKDSTELRKKLNAVHQNLVAKQVIEPKEKESQKTVKVSLLASERESKLYEQMRSAITAGELVSAVEDGVSLMRNFPSSQWAKEASDRVLQVYMGVSSRSSKKYGPLRDRVFRQMKKVGADWHFEWCRKLYFRGYYLAATKFADLVEEEWEEHSDLKKVLYLAGKSALYLGDYKKAGRYFNSVIKKSSGSEENEKALFYNGLLHYRLGKYSDSSAFFERLIAAFPDSDYELSSRYWLWRSQQVISPENSRKIAEAMWEKFPLSYYTLRSRAEYKLPLLANKVGKSDLSMDVQLTSTEYIGWEKFLIFLKAGWFEEAQAELSQIARPEGLKAQLIFARLHSLALDHFTATKLINRAWDEDKSYLNDQFVKMAYPVEFSKYISDYSAKNKLDKNLVYSLIRQESSFRVAARSRAGAMGLMQLMPMTAKGVAERLRIKNLEIPENLKDPAINVRLGTSYLAQMLRAFDGHVPMALAAYNAGIGRMRKWTRKRPAIAELSKLSSSDPRSEIWIDEMPWAETRFYVKAILRNLILYKYIQNGKYEITEPIW